MHYWYWKFLVGLKNYKVANSWRECVDTQVCVHDVLCAVSLQPIYGILYSCSFTLALRLANTWSRDECLREKKNAQNCKRAGLASSLALSQQWRPMSCNVECVTFVNEDDHCLLRCVERGLGWLPGPEVFQVKPALDCVTRLPRGSVLGPGMCSSCVQEQIPGGSDGWRWSEAKGSSEKARGRAACRMIMDILWDHSESGWLDAKWFTHIIWVAETPHRNCSLIKEHILGQRRSDWDWSNSPTDQSAASRVHFLRRVKWRRAIVSGAGRRWVCWPGKWIRLLQSVHMWSKRRPASVTHPAR